MRTLVVLLLLVSQSFAQYSASVDADGNVVAVEHANPDAPTGSTVIAVTSMEDAGPNRSHLFDDRGRCRYTATAGGPLVALATPRWPSHAGLRRARQRKVLEAIDVVHSRILVLERWQTLFSVTVFSRAPELTAATAERDALIAALTGP